jgi:NAD(P)H-dependent FMN reductase
MTDTKIVVLVGSLRSDSVNRRLAEKLVSDAPSGLDLEIVDGLAELPFYNEDLDTDEVPEAAQRLRDRVAVADRVLVVTPEYNGTMPAVLKNAIDWLSRPYGAGAFGGKPAAVVGTAFGQFGGVWAQDEARKAVNIAGGKVIEDIKLSIPGSLTRFAETHPVDDAEVAAQLTEVVARLHGNVGVAA